MRIRDLSIISHLSLWKNIEADLPQRPSDTIPLFRSWLGYTVWDPLKYWSDLQVSESLFWPLQLALYHCRWLKGSCNAWASQLQTVLKIVYPCQLLHHLSLDGISRNQDFQHLISITATLRLPLAAYFLIWKITLLHSRLKLESICYCLNNNYQNYKFLKNKEKKKWCLIPNFTYIWYGTECAVTWNWQPQKAEQMYTCMYIWDDVWTLWLIEND